MKDWFKKIINIGVDSSLDVTQQRIIILHNKFLFILTLVSCLRFVKDLIDFCIQAVSIDLFLLSLPLIGFLLTQKGYFNVMIRIIVCAFLVFTTTIKIVYGTAIGVDVTILVAMSLVVFFFRKKLERTIIFTAYGLTFAGSSWWLSTYGAFVSEGAIIGEFYYSFFVAGLIVMLLVAHAVVSEREDYQEEMERLLAELKAKDAIQKEQKKELEALNTDLEKFVFMASHDLKSPLRNITGFVNLIDQKIQKYEDPTLNEYMGFVLKGTDNMQNLIAGILDYSKIVHPENTCVDLDQVFGEVQHNLQHIIEERKAIVKVDAMPQILGDYAQMTMLFQNLIQNGIKYNESTEPTVEVSCTYKSDIFQVQIKDNGIGIAPEFRQRVFEMFRRLHNDSKYSGTGIGLATCKRIMEKSGGEIYIASDEDKGSIFTLEWPTSKIQQEETSALEVLHN